MKVSDYRIGFIGFGHMAQILFRALDQCRLIPRSQVLFTRRDRDKIRSCEQEFGITASSLENTVAKSDLLFLCVRPQQIGGILEKLRQIGVGQKLLISIAAGVKSSYIEKFLENCSLIRAMPNLPAAVGAGMTILSYGSQTTVEFRSLTHLLFGAMGEIVELSEHLMDLATGIAGSGPAYVFSLIEAAARLGEKGGIPYDKALKIGAQTFLGSAKILLQENTPVADLIQKIAVPNGTTEAGLKVLRAVDLDKHFASVMEAAATQAKALSEEFH